MAAAVVDASAAEKDPGIVEEAEQEALPAEIDDVVAVSDEELSVHLKERLHSSVRDGAAFDSALTAVLWNAEKALDRKPLLIQELLDLGSKLVQQGTGFKEVVEPGSRVAAALFRLSLARSLDAVGVRRAKVKGSPVALVLGFAGSCAQELEPQVAAYHSLGFTVISLTALHCPTRLQQRQFFRMARALRDALAESGGSGAGRLLVHSCSGHGTSFFSTIIRVWKSGQAPLESMPPLESCLAAVAFESVAFGEHPRMDSLKPVPAEEVDVEKDREAAPDAIFTSASQNTIVSLCTDCAPGVSWWRLPQEFRNLVRHISPRYENPRCHLGPYGVGHPVWGGHDAWFDLDRAMERPVPRLFLYSAEDKLYTPEAVESCTDEMWKGRRKAKFLLTKVLKGAHMKHWEDRKSHQLCVDAVTSLAKAARLPVKASK